MFFKKQKLTFDTNGMFKILVLSDYQETAETCSEAFNQTRRLLDQTKPNLVVLGGDIVNGPETKTKKQFKAYLSELALIFQERNIPFCHVFGNHDYDVGFSVQDEMKIYENTKGCLSKQTKGISGYTNFMLPIYDHSLKQIRFALWCIDSGNRMESLRAGLTAIARPFGSPVEQGPWDAIRFDQQEWYWNKSKKLEKKAKHLVPSLMVMHVAPWEFSVMRRSADIIKTEGHHEEEYNLGMMNSGIFFTVLQRGDVKCIAAGHTHRNDCSASYCNINLCNVSTAGYSSYGEDEQRGGRLFTILETSPETIRSEMVYYKDLD